MTLYKQDLFAWLDQQVDFLKTKQFDKLDINNLIDEVEAVSKSDKRSLVSHLANLMMHLLKIQYQPKLKSRFWESSVYNARLSFLEILEKSPSMSQFMEEIFEKAFKKARREAINETGFSGNLFPENCPWGIKEILEWNDFEFIKGD